MRRWNPPVCRIAGEAMLDKLHAWRAVSMENPGFIKCIILMKSTRCRYCTLQALADQDVIRSMLADQVKGEQGMAQMIQHAEE